MPKDRLYVPKDRLCIICPLIDNLPFGIFLRPDKGADQTVHRDYFTHIT